MDYRSAGLIMLSACIMWAQHRHDPLGSAQPGSEAVKVRYQACMATEPLAVEPNMDLAGLADSNYRLPSAFPALTRVLSVFQQGVATLRRTLDEVKKASLLFGWQVLGDERALAALLHARQPEPVVRCPQERVTALELGIPLTRASFALRAASTP